MAKIEASQAIVDVHYSIRGPLANRALEIEAAGQEVIKLNIGNPGIFGFDAPPAVHAVIKEHLDESESYCHQKGIIEAREAIVEYQKPNCCTPIDSEDIFLGNGVSELILMSLRALLNDGDEVLVPSPGYPLWTAAVFLSDGKAVHYPCRSADNYIPDPQEIRKLVTDKTKAIVIINPNNPSGAVYPESVVQDIAAIAEEFGLVAMSDEIYDQILYDQAQHFALSNYVEKTLCMTFSGLSKVHRACGYRVGWLCLSGKRDEAQSYIDAIELMASLRLCSNVPGQWAVPTALQDTSIRELIGPGGRLYESRQAVLDGVAASPYLKACNPQGALYAFIEVDTAILPDFNDEQFGLDLLEQQYVLVAPGQGFNVEEKNFFRVTFLPEPQEMRDVFQRIDVVLSQYAAPSSV
ncbi:MAG: aminotransferase class I/II-fold pyridoxal phosphate-dependent enzyme [Planctomycetes bacterium]|nr:aminotransferase class I/II-fold pyridoxal phosphate-dependent enzyme [Planctomycetota bacterium]